MNFKSYDRLNTVLMESTKVEKFFSDNLRPKLTEELMKLLKEYNNSPLAKYIIRRIHNPELNPPQKLEIGKVGNLDSYKMDKIFYDVLLDVKSGDIGPGEILIGLTLGDWIGGTKGDYDVELKDIGRTEVKYLVPFAKSTNVPMGSANKKRLIHTDIPVIFNTFVKIIKDKPKLLKRYLNDEEIAYFADYTLDQLQGNNDVSTNSLRLLGRILRSSENQKDNSFIKEEITFDRLKIAMESTLKLAMGEAEYLLFIGNRIKDDDEIGGKYYLMSKDDIKYYMFYRIYDGDRIKIAPFTTEKDFMQSRIYNK